MTQAESIRLLQDIVRFKTENDQEALVAEYLRTVLQEHGIPSQLIELSPGRSNLVAELTNGPGKVLGLTGHMDVITASGHRIPMALTSWTEKCMAAAQQI